MSGHPHGRPNEIAVALYRSPLKLKRFSATHIRVIWRG
jgi:hypothetical protein